MGKNNDLHQIKTGRGFTLVEIFIALAILAILVVVSLPAYYELLEKNDIRTVKSDIVLISADLEKYYADQSAYPPDLATIGSSLVDPWGNEYQYLNMALATGNGGKRKDRNLVPLNTDFDLYSKGPDGLSAAPLTAKKSRDDIILANNGKFIGLASEY